MLKWLRKKFSPAPEKVKEPSQGYFSTHVELADNPIERKAQVSRVVSSAVSRVMDSLPKVQATPGQAMDSSDDGGSLMKLSYGMNNPSVSDILLMWYMSQGFIGYQICAFLAQHWLIDKACSMPGRDAIRQGYDIISGDENKLDTKTIQQIKELDKEFNIPYHLSSFVKFGRIFGIRILFFKIDSRDPEYYEKPFNLDGITPGSYKGIVQVDPYWCAPWLDLNSTSQPDDIHFYEPTWWVINGKKYHRSHLTIFLGSEVADILKPSYLYGGVPVPQKIMERVYGAERTANEGPLLAMTKRTTVYKTNLEAAFANKETFDKNMRSWIDWRDNFQIKIADREDEVQQLDTTLTDLDEIIMGQYQIVAAAANVPATKLLGTTPKGFNATGEYEESSYHEELESLQANDLSPVLDRHHNILSKSMGLQITIKHEWRPVDSPTAAEEAEINAKKAATAKTYFDTGALDAYDIRDGLINDKQSGFTFIEVAERPDDYDPNPEPAPAPVEGGDKPGGQETGEKKVGSGQDGFEDFPWMEFSRGFKEEQEHFDTVNGNELEIAGIVLDHLKTHPQYYTELAQAGL
jgi:phage-related protein (TIGR01555 family)